MGRGCREGEAKEQGAWTLGAAVQGTWSPPWQQSRESRVEGDTGNQKWGESFLGEWVEVDTGAGGHDGKREAKRNDPQDRRGRHWLLRMTK